VPLNPNSGQQFADRLIERHGWQPRVLTEGGDPSVTAAVLATLDFPEAKMLLRHKIAAKRITMLSGDNGYLTLLGEDSRLHTNYSTLGAVTGRCTHKPNVAQVPRVSVGKDGEPLHGADGGWGYEFRDCFGPPPGWLLVGADQAGLELRLLSHYLYDFDGREYVIIVCEGDAHETNRIAAGIDSRSTAKRLIYATVYGCGDYKAGTIVEPDENDEFTIKWIGKLAKASLIDGIRGFRELFTWLDGINSTTLPGLDGRPLFSRKKYSRLNTLLQAAGAIICKRWVVLIDEELQCLGLHPGGNGDYEFVGFIHDELQTACRTMEIAEIVARVCVEMAIKAGEFYGLHCPTAGTAKIGATWAATH
jgi:DNA polymerase I-like protein with 3'-5' exonuclease and polymerase domains